MNALSDTSFKRYVCCLSQVSFENLWGRPQLRLGYTTEGKWIPDVINNSHICRMVYLTQPAYNSLSNKKKEPTSMYWPAFIAMLRFPTLARSVVETGCFRDVTFVVSWLENWCPLSWLLVGVFNLFETYANQIGSSPQVGVKIKNVWNHHPVIIASALLINFKLTTCSFHHHSYLYIALKKRSKNIPTNYRFFFV